MRTLKVAASNAAAFRIYRATDRDIGALADARVALLRELGEGPERADPPAFRARCHHVIAEGLSAETCVAWLTVGLEGRPMAE